MAEPKVYIACLAAYNEGHLHGEWIDADLDPDDIQAEIDRILSTSPIADAEEWAIHDCEYMPDLGETPSLEIVAEVGKAIAKYGDAFKVYIEHVGEVEIDGFEAAYQGKWDSEKDFAQEYFAEIYTIPDSLAFYIDYEAIARDLFVNDFYFENGFVFRR